MSNNDAARRALKLATTDEQRVELVAALLEGRSACDKTVACCERLGNLERYGGSYKSGKHCVWIFGGKGCTGKREPLEGTHSSGPGQRAG